MSSLLHALYRGDRATVDELLTADPSLDVFEAAALDWLSQGITISQRIGTPRTTATVHPRKFTAAMMRAALCLFEATARKRYLEDAQRWRDVLMRDFLIAETGILAMTAKDADRL